VRFNPGIPESRDPGIAIPVSYLLSCTVSKGRLLVNFSLATGGRFTLTPLLGVIPCEYPDKLYLHRN